MDGMPSLSRTDGLVKRSTLMSGTNEMISKFQPSFTRS